MKALTLLIALPATALPLKQSQLPPPFTDFIFNEREVNAGEIQMDPKTISYREDYANFQWRENARLMLHNKIKNLFDIWEKETQMLSSTSEIIQHQDFKKIVQLGSMAIPAVLLELQNRPSRLVWAMNLITGRNITEGPISIKDASAMWVDWGQKNKVI
jgi:hypothetical protein